MSTEQLLKEGVGLLAIRPSPSGTYVGGNNFIFAFSRPINFCKTSSDHGAMQGLLPPPLGKHDGGGNSITADITMVQGFARNDHRVPLFVPLSIHHSCAHRRPFCSLSTLRDTSVGISLLSVFPFGSHTIFLGDAPTF